MIRAWLVLNLVAVLAADVPAEQVKSFVTVPTPEAQRKTYQMKGVVQEVNPQDKSVTIKHEAVPGYMPAMTMPFEVRDTNELADIGAGDPVTFRLSVTDTDGWIDQIRKTGPKTNMLPAMPGFRVSREVEPLNPGDRLPEFHFLNQRGQPFSTAQFKGRALAINFLFTRCPFPTMCPATAKNFAATQEKLLALKNGPTNWQLLTISFDPQFDTPAVLAAYAENYRCKPERWTFATGELTEVQGLGELFGLTFWKDETGSISHNLRTVVIDANGRLQKVIVGNDWSVDELVAELVKAAAVK